MTDERIIQLQPVSGLDGTEWIPLDQSDGLGGFVTRRAQSGAIAAGPNNAPYVLAAASAFAPDGRVLTGTAGAISVTDGGAGTDITLDLIATGVAAATYGDATTVPQITVDADGRITAAANVPVSGLISGMSVVSANGFAGSVANPTTNPAITLSTTVTGILEGNGTAIAAASVTGSGAVVLATSPTLVTPALGTPSALVLTNATGLPIAGLTGLGTGVATALAVNVGSAGAFVVNGGALGTPSSGTLTNATGLPISSGVSGLGANVATALAVAVGSAGAFVTFDGALGTPSSGTLTNATGLPISTGVSGLGAGVATFLATPSSANLAAAVTGETGSGALVFGTSPSFTTDIRPVSNDGASLGISGTAFSDLFLASGGIVNWAAGDTTLTQSTGSLALGGSATDVVLDISAANAGQIKFPATQNASADVNTFDDYREGTWTPTMAFNGASVGITYTTQTGTYIKIGKFVLVSGSVVLSNNGSSTGTMQIASLPFTCSAVNYASIASYFDNMSGISGNLSGIIVQSTTRMDFWMPGATAMVQVADTNTTNTTRVDFTGFYIAAN